MKRFLVVLMAVALAAASQASVLVYEGFGDAPNNATLDGYSGTSAEIGLSGTWSVTPLDRQSIKARTNYEYVGLNGGYAPETTGDRQHWWEHDNSWSAHRAERPLSGSIDMTQDGTWYMSFFSMSGNRDYVAQVGLNDGTYELMWGNGYNGDSNKGLTAYYGGIGTNPTTNGNGTFVWGLDAFPLKTGFYAAKLVKSDSGVTDTLDVSIAYYDLGTLANPTNEFDGVEPTVWTRVVSLTGVSSVFSKLELKVDGGNENWPSIDEVRVGHNWLDVTVGNVHLIAPAAGEELVDVDTNLEWSVGNGWAVDVYLSGPYDEPNAAPVLSLVDAENSLGLYDPPADLENEKWYYWRVDELEPNTVGYIVHPGQVWSFKTIGLAAIITANPVSMTVSAGMPQVQLSVMAENAESYQWYKDGVPLADDVTDTLYVGQDAATLTIFDVQLEDEGSYYCVADNSLQTPAASTAARLMTERLVGWWKLDGDLTDSVDEAVPGAATHDGVCPDPNFVAEGKDGGAQQFYGDINSIVTIADSGDFFNFYPLGYTVSAWVKMPVKSGSWGAYVAKQGDDPQRGFILTHNGSGQPVHTLRQSFNDLSSNRDADDDNWHLVTGTYDSVSKQGKVYVDGVLANQATHSGIPQASPAALIFGAERPNGESPFVGILDDVRIWSYPLDALTIASLYVDFNPGEDVCIAYPEFDIAGPDGVGDAYRDCRVNLYDLMPIIQKWLDCNLVPTCLP
jgi:hypothetical protein